jgi:hypothetical protein
MAAYESKSVIQSGYTFLGDCAVRRYLFIPVDDMWVMLLFC